MPASQPDRFDVIVWIECYFAEGERLDFEHLRPALCFSLIWNLFEWYTCDRDANYKTIQAAVNKANSHGVLDQNRYMEFFEFFRDRYVHDGDLVAAFHDLMRDDKKSEAIVRDVLLADAPDVSSMVSALLLIAYRIRNNLFHGNKHVSTLHTQVELFQVVNQLLATFVDDFKMGMPYFQVNLPKKR